jgi:hypothetical protein
MRHFDDFLRTRQGNYQTENDCDCFERPEAVIMTVANIIVTVLNITMTAFSVLQTLRPVTAILVVLLRISGAML